MSGENVTYTVKELLAKLETALTQGFETIDKRLNALDHKLDDKAPNSVVRAVEDRVRAVEDRIGKIELAQGATAAVTVFQRWLVGTVAVGMLGAVATLVWLASGGH